MSLEHFDRAAERFLPSPQPGPTSTAEIITLRTELPAPPVRRLRATWASDLTSSAPEPDLIDGVLPNIGLGSLYGPSNCGKTAAVIDMACRIATGLPWQGKEVQKGVVLYVAAEAPVSVERRVMAWRQHYGHSPDKLLIMGQSVDLVSNDADLQALIELVEKAKARGPVRLIVIDTQARVTPGADENGSKDMGRLVANLDKLREATEAFTLLIHHTGKDTSRGARGSNAIKCAADVELECDAGVLTITKSRDDRVGAKFGFRIEGVPYFTDEEGRAYTAAVAVASDAVAAPDRGPSLSTNQALAFKSITAALVDEGREPPPARDIPPRVRVVSYDHALEKFMRHDPERSPRRAKDEFKRQVRALLGKNAIKLVEGWLWLPQVPQTAAM